MTTSILPTAQRIVVKVGSSLVTNEGKGLDHAALARWAEEIAQLTRLGKQVVLVSSAPVAEGIARLGWTQKPTAVHEKQAAAAVGQIADVRIGLRRRRGQRGFGPAGSGSMIGVGQFLQSGLRGRSRLGIA